MDILEQLESLVGQKRILHNEPLNIHTIGKIPHIAEYYLEVDKLAMLSAIIQVARKVHLPFYILGGGARIKVNKRIEGLVIKNACRKFDTVGAKGGIRNQETNTNHVLVYTESGVIVNQLVRYTIEEGLEGLEYQLGLPGTVGGAIYTNAKYVPKYLLLNNALQSISILGKDGTVQSYTKALPHFVYIEEEWEETEDIILSAVFRLTVQDKKELWRRGEEAVAWREKEGKNTFKKEI